MIRKLIEIACPVRIYGPVRFKVTAGPVQKRISRRAFGNFHTVVQTHHANAAFFKCLQAIQLAVKRMSAATIRIDDNRIGAVQHRFVFRPALCVDTCFNAQV